ncbi:MAG: alkaline phosphatase family protein, partial [Acidobacteria bacterium]|nr:alkaline phosphatase family protein [Acidobacteriota bacterium]
MRFLRMLTNAVVVGLLGSAYVTALVLQLNPQVPLVSMTSVHWAMAVAGFYGVLLTVLVWLVLFLRDLFSLTPTVPGWLSVRILAWISAIFTGAMSWVTWGNLRGLRAVLDDAAADRLQAGATAMTVCAVLLLVTAVLRFSFGRRGGRPTGVLLTLVMLASVTAPLLTRGVGDVAVPTVRGTRSASAPTLVAPAEAEQLRDLLAGRVRVILLDGASLGYIRVRVAAGQLANFGKILDSGAIVPLATLKPTQPEPVWAAAATGKYPPKNGVRSSYIYRANPADTDTVNLLPDYCFSQGLIDLGFVTATAASADALRARPLWDILADYSLSSGIVRWPLTSPARAARGFTISDRFEDTSQSPLRLDDATNGAPTTAAEIAREAFDQTQFTPWPDVLPDDFTAAASASSAATIAKARWDRSYREALARLNDQGNFNVQLSAIRYTGIDMLSHAYFAYTEPARLASLTRNVSPEDQRRFGGAVDRYYKWIDEQVEATMASLEPGDLLLVVSGFGMEPVSLQTALINRVLGEEQSGTHEGAPQGFLLAYGVNVAPGEYARGSIVDLAPTILYYMGAPIGRDMDG